jgi:hypothetical protein
LEKLSMTTEIDRLYATAPHTATLQHVLSETHNQRATDDFLFLERWEICPLPGSAAAQRVSQIRRANPELVTEIRRELAERDRTKPAPSSSSRPHYGSAQQ